VEIIHDETYGNFRIEINTNLRILVDYDDAFDSSVVKQAELLAIKIKELLGIWPNLKNAFRVTADLRFPDSVAIKFAIDRTREAEKRLKPKERFVSLVCGGDMSCSSGVSLKMTSAQIDTNLAALQKVKEGLNE